MGGETERKEREEKRRKDRGTNKRETDRELR